MTTTLDLATDLGMLQDDDIRAVIAELADLHGDAIPDDIAAEVHQILDPHGERTALARRYWPGHDDKRPDDPGTTFRSPVRGEGRYPEL